MPPTPEQIEKAQDCLAEIRLVNFTATPDSILAGQESAIRWDVDISGCAHPGMLGIHLNATRVPVSGSRRIRPGRAVTYSLSARAAGLLRPLGRVNVHVDDSACRPFEISEEEVVPLIQGSIRSSIEEYNANPETDNPVTLRSPPGVQIEPGGVVIRIRLELEINNFFNPDVDVDARIGIGVSAEGAALAFYKSFAVDVDWPWWVSGITHGITKIVEEFIDDLVEAQLKQKILNDFRDSVRAQVRAFTGVVSEIETAQDRIVVTVCSPPPAARQAY
jgi:hypothetical protein